MVLWSTPFLLYAQLSSTNFIVEGPAISGANNSGNATSTNFDVDIESGGLYIYDTPTTDTGSGGGGGSKSNDSELSKTNSGVLGKLDSITICHSANGKKYVALSNVQVFTTLAESGFVAELRGHDGHDKDIVPAFSYDFGDGVKTYPGNNWSSSTERLHQNNCRLFLEQPEATSPEPPSTAPSALPETATTPPTTLEVPVCSNVSQPVAFMAAADEDTMITGTLLPGGVASKSMRGTKSNYQLQMFLRAIGRNKSAELTQGLGQYVKEIVKTKKDVRDLTQLKTSAMYAPTLPSMLPPVVKETDQRVIAVSAGCDSDTVNTIALPVSPENIAPLSQFTAVSSDTIPNTPDIAPNQDFVFVVESTTNIDALINVVASGTVVAGVEVQVVDEQGVFVEQFEKPVSVSIFNPVFAEVTANNIVILQPSADGAQWHVLPFNKTDDTVTVELLHPGQIFVWFTPSVAEAAEPIVDTNQEVRQYFIPSTIEVDKRWLNFLTGLGAISLLILSYLQLAATPFSFTHITRNLVLSGRRLFALITLQKKRRPWGTVYDAETKAPLDPAVVVLRDQSGQLIKQAITDLDGRYGFVVPPGKYSIEAKKTNYSFPSQKVRTANSDILYHNLYYGGPLEVADQIINDIPMDPVNFDWNQYEKLRTKQTHFFNRLDPVFIRLLDYLSIFGAILLLWQAISQTTLLSVLFVGIYLVLLWKRFHAKAPLLYGYVLHHKASVPFALIKIYAGQQEVTTRIADTYGRYFALVSPGAYRVEVYMPHGDDEYTQLSSQILKTRNGVVNASLRV